MTAFIRKTLILIGILIANPQSYLAVGLWSASPLALSQTELSERDILSLASQIAKLPKDQSLSLRLQLARHYSEKGDPGKVADYLRPVVDLLDVSGMRLLAKAYADKNDFLQEVRILENLVAKNPSDYVSYTHLAEAYLRIKQEDNAVTNYQKAISLNERHQPAYEGYLNALDKAGKRYEYRVTLIDMAKIFGESPEILNLTCKAYYQDGFLEDARNACQKAISKSPETADNHIYYGLTLEAENNEKRAFAIIQQAAKQYPQSEFAQYTAGKMSEDKKDSAAAHKYYRQGTVADESSARNWLGLGRMAFASKNYEESLEAFKNACKHDRSNSVQDFQSAATKLKLENNNYEWKEKFGSEATRCRYLPNK